MGYDRISCKTIWMSSEKSLKCPAVICQSFCKPEAMAIYFDDWLFLFTYVFLSYGWSSGESPLCKIQTSEDPTGQELLTPSGAVGTPGRSFDGWFCHRSGVKAKFGESFWGDLNVHPAFWRVINYVEPSPFMVYGCLWNDMIWDFDPCVHFHYVCKVNG